MRAGERERGALLARGALVVLAARAGLRLRLRLRVTGMEYFEIQRVFAFEILRYGGVLWRDGCRYGTVRYGNLTVGALFGMVDSACRSIGLSSGCTYSTVVATPRTVDTLLEYRSIRVRKRATIVHRMSLCAITVFKSVEQFSYGIDSKRSNSTVLLLSSTVHVYETKYTIDSNLSPKRKRIELIHYKGISC